MRPRQKFIVYLLSLLFALNLGFVWLLIIPRPHEPSTAFRLLIVLGLSASYGTWLRLYSYLTDQNWRAVMFQGWPYLIAMELCLHYFNQRWSIARKHA